MPIISKSSKLQAEWVATVACEMDTIRQIASRHQLKVIEDAAQGVMAQYKEQYLGTLCDFGCFSFHETKIILWERAAHL